MAMKKNTWTASVRLKVNSKRPQARKTISPLQSVPMGTSKQREWRWRTRLLFASLSWSSVAEAVRIRLDLQVEATSLEDACSLVWNNSETFMKEWQGKANTATSNPDDSHICKFMQIVVNLWAASIWKGESWGESQEDRGFLAHLAHMYHESLTEIKHSSRLASEKHWNTIRFKKKKNLLFCRCVSLFLETHLPSQVTFLREICQSKRPCKYYGNKLCVALSLKENIISCSAPLWALDTGDVIFAAYLGPSRWRGSATARQASIWRCWLRDRAGRGLHRWCSCTNAVINVHTPGLRQLEQTSWLTIKSCHLHRPIKCIQMCTPVQATGSPKANRTSGVNLRWSVHALAIC